MSYTESARRKMANINKAATYVPDDEAAGMVDIFPSWSVGTTYAIGDRIAYDGKLYKVVQAHTSQADWLPPSVPALCVEVAKPGEIPVWVQPTGAQDAYSKGDKVHYPDAAGPVYISLIDGNLWSPEAYPQGWEKE